MQNKILETLYEIITPSKREMFDRIAAERTKHVTVVLENIYQDHNASAVLRTCDCFGIQQMHTIEKGNKYKIQRDIARGAGKWVDITHHSDQNPVDTCFNQLRQEGFQIWAATPHAPHFAINDLPIHQPLAIVFGTEWQGISAEVEQKADGLFRLPMYGFTESFNVSVSAALVLSQLRNRLQASDIPFLLTREEQTLLKIQWSTKILRNGEKLVEEIERRLLDQSN